MHPYFISTTFILVSLIELGSGVDTNRAIVRRKCEYNLKMCTAYSQLISITGTTGEHNLNHTAPRTLDVGQSRTRPGFTLPSWKISSSPESSPTIVFHGNPSQGTATPHNTDQISKFNSSISSFPPPTQTIPLGPSSHIVGTQNGNSSNLHPTAIKPQIPTSRDSEQCSTSVFTRHVNCSGTSSSDGRKTLVVTSTLVTSGQTVTLPEGAPSPPPIMITPSPACVVVIKKCIYNGPKVYTVGLTPVSTLLVTKKTLDVAYSPSSVGQIFPEPTGQVVPHLVPALQPTRDAPPIGPPASPNKKPAPPSKAPPATHPGAPSDGGSNSPDNHHSIPASNTNGMGDNPRPAGGDAPSQPKGDTPSPGEDDSPSNEGGDNLASQKSPPIGASNVGSGSQGNKANSGSSNEDDNHTPGTILTPTDVTVNEVAVQIKPTAIIIGDQVIPAGASSTQVVAQGQTFTVGPSEIQAAGRTIPLIPVGSTTPSHSTVIAGSPVVLQPDRVVIESQTFTPQPAAKTFIYKGQTYQLDSSQLIAGHSTLALPQPAPALSLVTAGGQVFIAKASEIIAPGVTAVIPHDQQTSTFALKGQTFKLNPSEIIAEDRTVKLPLITPPPGSTIIEGHTFALDNAAVVFGSQTYPINVGSPTIIIDHGRKVSIGPQGIGFASTTVPIPTRQPSFSIYNADGEVISLASNKAIIAGKTYSLGSPQPTTVSVNGQIFRVDRDGIALDSTTFPIPSYKPSFSTITEGDLTFSIAPSEAVIAGKTYMLTKGAPPVTTKINGQLISIGPDGVGLAGTTAALGSSPTATTPHSSVILVNGISFSLQPSNVVISGTTYPIGPGSHPKTINLSGETISLGPDGIGLPSTTIVPEEIASPSSYISPSVTVVDGITFSLSPSAVIISGTAYPIGPSSHPETINLNGEQISLGPNGIGLPSTTIAPENTLTPSTSTTVINGITLSLSPSNIIVSGTTYPIPPSSHPKTFTLNSETISIGPNGIGFPSTTLIPAIASPSVTVINGITFSLYPSDVVISGTTYPIGPDSTPETITMGNEGVSLGPGGVGLARTTVGVGGIERKASFSSKGAQSTSSAGATVVAESGAMRRFAVRWEGAWVVLCAVMGLIWG